MLENLFGKKQAVEEPPVEIKKEEIKGDAKNFNNARAMLQQNFGKGGGNTNVMNVQPSGGTPNLPPPPPPLNIPQVPTNPLPPPPINIQPPSSIHIKIPTNVPKSSIHVN